METINKLKLKEILGNILESMQDAKDELIALDGAMGDGDLGLTMCKGFEAIYQEIDMGKLMMKLGMKMNSVVPSTMGTLISTCFVKSAPKAKGKSELNLTDLVEMGKAAVDGVMQRGGSKIDDKTMLDALAPAINALEQSLSENKTLAEAQQAAYQASIEGVEKTKTLKSVHGRAAYYNEQSIGKQDPGATAVMYIFRGIAKSFLLNVLNLLGILFY